MSVGPRGLHCVRGVHLPTRASVYLRAQTTQHAAGEYHPCLLVVQQPPTGSPTRFTGHRGGPSRPITAVNDAAVPCVYPMAGMQSARVACVRVCVCVCVSLAQVAMDEQGMPPDSLRHVLSSTSPSPVTGCRPKVIYLIPSGQNPTGAVMTVERKREIYEVSVTCVCVCVCARARVEHACSNGVQPARAASPWPWLYCDLCVCVCVCVCVCRSVGSTISLS